MDITGIGDQKHIVAGFALAKGLTMAVLAAALNIEFWQGLIIAAVSATIGAVGMVSAAVISRRAAQENRELIRDVQSAVGADRRQTDRGPRE